MVVRYLVDSQGFGGFQGQVQVVNDGTQPIAGWQIVIALPDDTMTAVQNAGGFVSNGILLLQPADAAEVVPPGGGTLNVFFVAEGTETIPAACTFNGIDLHLAGHRPASAGPMFHRSRASPARWTIEPTWTAAPCRTVQLASGRSAAREVRSGWSAEAMGVAGA